MTATIYQTPGTSSRLFVFILLCAVATVLLAVLYGSHATEKHGDAAVMVRECIERGGEIERWLNPDTRREAVICEVKPGKYGIQIQRFEREVTSFIKDKLRNLEQVRRYLINRGYVQQ